MFDNFIDVFKGDNGPAYVGTIGIVLIMCLRYGYRFIGKGISIEPDMPVPAVVNAKVDSIEEAPDDGESDV